MRREGPRRAVGLEPGALRLYELAGSLLERAAGRGSSQMLQMDVMASTRPRDVKNAFKLGASVLIRPNSWDFIRVFKNTLRYG